MCPATDLDLDLGGECQSCTWPIGALGPARVLLGTSHARRRCTDFLRVDSAITLSTMVNNALKVIPTLLGVDERWY